jgi:hypothetical protein
MQHVSIFLTVNTFNNSPENIALHQVIDLYEYNEIAHTWRNNCLKDIRKLFANFPERNIVKSSRLASFLLCIAFGASANYAQAGLSSSASVDGLATFEDTSTGLVWLQLPDMFNLSYAAQVTAAESAGFTVANFATVSTLWADTDLGSGDWTSVEAITGGSSSRALIWGNYADTLNVGGGPNGWGYAYGGDTSWSYYNPDAPAESFSDLGLWAYETSSQQSSVPEPASLALVGLGLLAAAAARRKAKQQ